MVIDNRWPGKVTLATRSPELEYKRTGDILMPRLNEVFGIATSVPTYTYVDRSGLDDKFKYLLAADRHVVIHGSSKQGKTILRKKNMPDQDSIVLQCRASTTCLTLYTEMLGQIGAEIPKELSTSLKYGGAVSGSGSGKVGIPLVAEGKASVDATASVEQTSEQKSEVVGQSAESLRYVNDVLKKTGKRVIVEDFHYVPEEEKRKLAFDLKALWDMKTFFIIVGVWAEQNLLQYYNGDLSGRIEEIDIQWNIEELREVLSKGEAALNVSFGQSIENSMIDDSNQSVGLLQRIAEKYCFNCGILETAQTEFIPKTIANDSMVGKARESICHEEDSRYRQFGNAIEKGFKSNEESELKVYQHIARVCMEASDAELMNGVHYNMLLDRVQQYNSRVRQSDLTAALQRLNKLQEDRSISPLVISYNPKSRLVQLVDRELLFYRKYGSPVWPWSAESGISDQQLKFPEPSR